MKVEEEPEKSTPPNGESPPRPNGQAFEPRYVQRGRAQLSTMLKEAANYRELAKTPYGLRPLLVFAVVSVVVSLDSGVLSNAIPEITLSLDVRLIEIIGILSVLDFIAIFFFLGLAFLADRVSRVWIIGLSSMVMGVASFFSSRVTAGAHATGYFGAARALSSDLSADGALGTNIGSLLADYYPPETRGKAFALRGVLSRVVRVLSPLVVAYLIVLSSLSWRLPYLITAPLLVLLGIGVLVTLKDPVRGYMERRAMGVGEEAARIAEEPPSFGEAWRTLWSVRTLRRLFISDIPFSVGDFIYGVLIASFLFQEYQMSVVERAFLAAVTGVFALPFGFMAGGMVDVLIRRRPHRVLIFSGTLTTFASIFVWVIASKPPVWIVWGGFVLFVCAASLVGPARQVLFAQVIPAHTRTLGLALRELARVPGFFIRGAIIGYAISQWGLQGGLYAAVPFFVIGGIIEISAAGLFERDMRSALASQMASDEWRRAKAEGRGKLLVLRDVDVHYDGVQVLFGIDFDVEEGQIIALLGQNGSGKSTLLKAISAVQEASSGAVVFDGRDITHMPTHEIAQRGIIHMPGGKGVFPGLSVRDNITLGTWMTEPDEIRKRLDEIYALFPNLKDRQGLLAGSLSGGEQQMVSLAQALLGKPRMLMIDELSLGLSPAVVAELIEVIKRIHATGVTIILVEQSVNVALTVAERAIFMEKGEVRFVGKTKELLQRPDILRAVYVKGTGALVEGGQAAALKSEREMRRYEIERARPILEVQQVVKMYGGVTALDEVTLDLKEGEALGIIGPNGAGKTTLFDIISGTQPLDRGRIVFDGVDVTGLRADERANRRLVRRFQDARLFPSLSVYENILVALDWRMDVKNVVFTALQLPQVRQSERRLRLRAERLLELLGLAAYRDKFVKELSTGLRRITDLACVLATEPKVLLLDEPSSGIAQAESEALGPLLRRVRFETGCSLLAIEHDMPLISAISDELIAMDQGRVIVRGTPDDVLNDERVIESYLGGSQEAIRRSGLL